MISVRVVKMTIMQVIHVAFMPNGRVTAAGAVLMSVIGVVGMIAGRHVVFLLGKERLMARCLGRMAENIV